MLSSLLQHRLKFKFSPHNSTLIHSICYMFLPYTNLILEFFLRPTDSRPVRLGIGPPLGLMTRFIFLFFFGLTITFSFSYGILSDEKMGL
jgi:hypothetical protein